MKISLNEFTAILGGVEQIKDGISLTCAPLTSARAVYMGELSALPFAQSEYLYVDVCSFEAEHASPVVNLEFWENNELNGEPDLTVRITCLPRVRTRLILPLDALDAQRIFLRRTPGSFRGFITGTRVDPSRVMRFAVGLREYWAEQRVEIYEIGLTGELPESPVPELPLVDELGQWMRREWDEKSLSIEEVTQRLRDQLHQAAEGRVMEGTSRFGGYKGLRFDATGFFRLDQKEGRHYLVDPEGYAFFSTGIDSAGPNIECPYEVVKPFFTWLPEKEDYPDAYNSLRGVEMVDFLKVNLRRAFGDGWFEKWTEITRAFFAQWGFNTIGNHSRLAEIPDVNIPYVHQLRDFPMTEKNIYRDFPDVFSEEYKRNAIFYAEQMREKNDDPYLIGYFMRNEPQWGFGENLEIAAELLLHPDTNFVSRRVFTQYLREKYENISALNAAWGLSLSSFDALNEPFASLPSTDAAMRDLNDFSCRMIREYVRVPAEALRIVAPNHLNLGMRYAFILYPNQCAGKEFLDIFSINCYKIDPAEVLANATDILQMPVLIGEFHFGSIDKGLGSTGIIGVQTQKDRGLAYQRYLEACALNSFCVGAHWFTLYDQSCMGRFDGENYQIGILDICNHPYEDFVAGILHAHERLYPLMAGEIPPERPEPKAAKSNIAS